MITEINILDAQAQAFHHCVAISNRRLISIEHRDSMETSQVTFQYRASDTGQLKRCTLSVANFLHRFLQHVLPHGFVKVRYYGFFGATLRPRLSWLQNHLGKTIAPEQPDETHQDTPQTELHQKILRPTCGKPMLFQRDLLPNACLSP